MSAIWSQHGAGIVVGILAVGGAVGIQWITISSRWPRVVVSSVLVAIGVPLLCFEVWIVSELMALRSAMASGAIVETTVYRLDNETASPSSVGLIIQEAGSIDDLRQQLSTATGWHRTRGEQLTDGYEFSFRMSGDLAAYPTRVRLFRSAVSHEQERRVSVVQVSSAAYGDYECSRLGKWVEERFASRFR